MAAPAELELAANDVLLLATKTHDTATAVRDWAWSSLDDAGFAATFPGL